MIFQSQKGAISLFMTALLMMLITVMAMLFLYMARYGHLPFPELRARWGHSADVISNELKSVSGLKAAATATATNKALSKSADLQSTVTIESGVQRCTIHGKVVYSDTECLSNNATTRTIKLHDNRADAPKPVTKPNEDKDASEVDLKMKMIDKLSK
ncbi:hypothetical protein [Undibacterium parvum]|uniref:Uncharacterized protein n=1 Tax=Undibacterium parvum TaxID=401471 RepID=A0A3Q9BRX6_9BURK|nr:hypothetical protein [Undibacterium parvum]AZP13120.1 hypothetical protein EJN92_14600 [Undibacterium parvum]